MSEAPITSPIVSPGWLRRVLENPELAPGLVLCDVRAYLDGRSGREAFERGHLPGARFIDLDTTLAGPPGPVVGRHPLPEPAVFAAGLADAGITHDTPVVAYDDAGGMIAGRLVWMLRILGQPAALLDGGIDHWEGDLDLDEPHVERADHEGRPWPLDAIVDANGVAQHIEEGGLVVDSRGRARYRGEHEPIDPKPGHVPGAINLPFTENLDDGAFRPLREIAERFRNVGVDDQTVFYCGSGVSACNNALAAEAAGFGLSRIYVGSWSGWCSDDGRPVATS